MTEIAERGSRKAGDLGRTTIADGVVAKIAFLAAGEVVGVHALGSGISRSVGALRKRVPGGTTSTHGVKVEVGEKQAAVDLDVVVDYGEVIPEVGKAVRENVISSVERMTGLEVVEVNIAVSDVWLPEEEEEPERVQ
ncbi:MULTISPECIES: Asp23/Gls24 family envelope stress response protein [Streptomyces]|uniref:Asp23/Gls24 family envelope stress response protein n=1 Tax=Streptomyces TaxID=1883 RepID=UPI00201FECB2|nr:Asp23/Gls24 family envelope stress response protein [Streptomyces sp. MCA2]MCL7495483.1 Asp23/Gls24 family envelope stress response protein [Streptomyces sp. MCA2]